MKWAVVVGALALGGVPAAQAAPPGLDPDWPCQQIRMPALSLASVWTGPDVSPYLATWSHDAAVADLAGRVAQRRLPLPQAEQAIRDFAATAGAQKRDKLLALMAGLFSALDAQRAQVVSGLDRFGRRQKELAEGIRGDMAKLRAQQAATDAAAQQQVAQLGERLQWETRLFEQRRQEVQFACDVPNVIEQRLYALAQTIQGLLG